MQKVLLFFLQDERTTLTSALSVKRNTLRAVQKRMAAVAHMEVKKYSNYYFPPKNIWF